MMSVPHGSAENTSPENNNPESDRSDRNPAPESPNGASQNNAMQQPQPENPLASAEISSSVRSDKALASELEAKAAAVANQDQIKKIQTPLVRLENGVAVLSLGTPDEKSLTINLERFAALREVIEDLHRNPPKGLVITGPNSSVFAHGADIGVIQTITDPAIGERIAKEGQGLFNEIAKLPCKKVVAISGPCVGGGCEMALACDVRIMSSDPKSQIGLPETQLGILPGWGGTQRLPRTVGLRKAMKMILGGEILRPEDALKAGLVDKVVPPAELHDRAIAIAAGEEKVHKKQLSFADRLSTAEGIVGRIVRSYYKVRETALKDVRAKAGDFYPALPASIDSMLTGLDYGMKKGLDFEAKKLGELIVSPESKSLVHIFFLREGAKGLGKPGRQAIEKIDTVVVGAGVMGAGIACVLAKNETGVVLKDINDAAIKKGMDHIESSLSKSKRLTADDRAAIMGRIETTTGDSPAIARCNFAIEAAPERMEIKKRVMADLGNKMKEDAIIATNTSSLSIKEIASVVKNPERVIGMHWFFPPEIMPLMEIVVGENTSQKAIDAVAAYSIKMGKLPIVVTDVPGFLVNRILTPYMNEATYLMKEGYKMEDIDLAAKKFGMPMGPVRLLDEVGLDTCLHVGKTMIAGYGDRMIPPPYVQTLNEKGLMGRKNQKGFYNFDPAKKDPEPNPEVRAMLGIEAPEIANPDLKYIERRLVLTLINEAVRCLDEGVAGKPGAKAAGQIDLGTVMGTGFPPFRGGLMHYAESVGAATLLKEMQEMEAKHGSRFTPAPGLAKRAASGKGFFESMD